MPISLKIFFCSEILKYGSEILKIQYDVYGENIFSPKKKNVEESTPWIPPEKYHYPCLVKIMNTSVNVI